MCPPYGAGFNYFAQGYKHFGPTGRGITSNRTTNDVLQIEPLTTNY